MVYFEWPSLDRKWTIYIFTLAGVGVGHRQPEPAEACRQGLLLYAFQHALWAPQAVETANYLGHPNCLLGTQVTTPLTSLHFITDPLPCSAQGLPQEPQTNCPLLLISGVSMSWSGHTLPCCPGACAWPCMLRSYGMSCLLACAILARGCWTLHAAIWVWPRRWLQWDVTSCPWPGSHRWQLSCQLSYVGSLTASCSLQAS